MAHAYEQPLLDEGGNGKEDAAELAYATPAHQRQLRDSIFANNPPVMQRYKEVADFMRAHDGVVLFKGETGSGKSLFAPGAVMEALRARGLPQKILMVQPRRDAARLVAQGTAAVQDARLGTDVGYSTSEARELHANTPTKIVTPGIAIRYLQEGMSSENVGAIILDEAHERSLEYDLILGQIKRLQKAGKAPLIVLASATFDREKLSRYFDIPKANFLQIEGRTYPVQKEYRPAPTVDGREVPYVKHAAQVAKETAQTTADGDILVFLPGAREINACISHIGDLDAFEVLPLHGSLDPDSRQYVLDQKKRPPGVRRIIVSTNIAETSVTLPHVKHVVDSCRERTTQYEEESGVTKTGTGFISKKQAEQRAGRAGRVSEGTCIRLVDMHMFETLQDSPIPEIHRSNLSQVVLRLIGMGESPFTFPFIDQPRPESIQAAYTELKKLGALDTSGLLTSIGKEMAEIPFEPHLARMIVEAKHRGCVESALVMAAFNREGRVLLGPTKHDEEMAGGYNTATKKINARKIVQSIQSVFDDPNLSSDHLKHIHILKAALANGLLETSTLAMRTPEQQAAYTQFKSWCTKHYLNIKALLHIAHRLRDYAYYARVPFSLSELQNSLGTHSTQDITSVLLSAYPEKLLQLEYAGRGLPVYSAPYTGTQATISPMSEGFDARPRLCIATQIAEGKGRDGSWEVKRNYASGIHPITLADIRAVYPDRVTSVKGEPEEGWNGQWWQEITHMLVGTEYTETERIAVEPPAHTRKHSGNLGMHGTDVPIFSTGGAGGTLGDVFRAVQTPPPKETPLPPMITQIPPDKAPKQKVDKMKRPSADTWSDKEKRLWAREQVETIEKLLALARSIPIEPEVKLSARDESNRKNIIEVVKTKRGDLIRDTIISKDSIPTTITQNTVAAFENTIKGLSARLNRLISSNEVRAVTGTTENVPWEETYRTLYSEIETTYGKIVNEVAETTPEQEVQIIQAAREELKKRIPALRRGETVTSSNLLIDAASALL